MDNGGIWPGDEYYFESLKEKSYEERIKELKKELAEARAEIENKQYTIVCASEENQQLKESLAEARAEIERLKNLVIDCTDWNWLDEDAFDTIPENITDATDAIVKERLNIGG